MRWTEFKEIDFDELSNSTKFRHEFESICDFTLQFCKSYKLIIINKASKINEEANLGKKFFIYNKQTKKESTLLNYIEEDDPIGVSINLILL